jgi:hypothetical protein
MGASCYQGEGNSTGINLTAEELVLLSLRDASSWRFLLNFANSASRSGLETNDPIMAVTNLFGFVDMGPNRQRNSKP